ncbi:MAG: hypothetical protein JWN84_1195 [Nocardioides sp.]|nr:hypothetical protein [Nocardioides sp.]
MRGPAVAVVVPVHDQALFLPRALDSLCDQEHARWEAVVVDDGSHDDPVTAVAPYLVDERVRLVGWDDNRGLGAALNAGLDETTAPVVAYLPADDVWDADHLATLLDTLDQDPGAGWAWSGVRHHETRTSPGAPPGHPVQLVQVAHRRTPHRWVERDELETDDLGRLLWDRLGEGVATGQVTATWTDHPDQRHKTIRESLDGGLNVFRGRYRVAQPLRFHSSDSDPVDEVARYARFRERTPESTADGLRVLVVGELAFNPERVVALAERGHELHGLWTRDGLGVSTVGPVPFGHVRDLPAQADGDWAAAVTDLRPDVVWAQLNWRVVDLALAVRRRFPDLPFVFHYKESPQRSMARGDWAQLAELFTTADASLVASAEERDFLLAALPCRLDPDRIGVLDGDLPPRDWLAGESAPRLSDVDGEPHTVVLGRPLGLDAAWVTALAAEGVHVHCHGPVAGTGPGSEWVRWWQEAESRSGGRLHRHPAVGPEDWVSVLSRYDAGWLHRIGSTNGGDVRVATWDDCNVPARLPTLMAAGLPLLVPDTAGHRVAVARIAAEDGTGLPYDLDDPASVAGLLHDSARVDAARDAAWTAREHHVFDAHLDRLEGVLRSVVGRQA